MERFNFEFSAKDARKQADDCFITLKRIYKMIRDVSADGTTYTRYLLQSPTGKALKDTIDNLVANGYTIEEIVFDSYNSGSFTIKPDEIDTSKIYKLYDIELGISW